MFVLLFLRYVAFLASLFFLVLVSGAANAQAVIIPFGQPIPDVKVPMNFNGHKIPFSTIQPSVTPANSNSFSPNQSRPSSIPMQVRPISASPTYSSLGPALALPVVGEVFGWALGDIEKRLNAKYDKDKQQFFRDLLTPLDLPKESENYAWQRPISDFLNEQVFCIVTTHYKNCYTIANIDYQTGSFDTFSLNDKTYTAIGRLSVVRQLTAICTKSGYCSQHGLCCNTAGCSCPGGLSSGIYLKYGYTGENSGYETEETIFRNYGFFPNLSEPLSFEMQDLDTLPTLMYYWQSLRDSSPATLEVDPLISTFTDLQTNTQYEAEVAPVNNPVPNPYKNPLPSSEPATEPATQPKTNANFDTKPMLDAMGGLQTALYAVANGLRSPISKTTFPTTIGDAVGSAVKCPLCSMGGQILSSLSTLKNVMTAEQLASMLSGLTMTIQLQELNDNFEITDIEKLSGISVSDAALQASDTVKDMANLNTSSLQANIQSMLDSLPKPNIDLGIPNSGSCPSPDVIPFLNSSITIDYGAFCDVMDKYGDILKMFVMSLGVLILTKNFFIKGST